MNDDVYQCMLCGRETKNKPKVWRFYWRNELLEEKVGSICEKCLEGLRRMKVVE